MRDRTEYDQQYHHKNREQNLARMRAYWRKNRDTLNAKRNAKAAEERRRRPPRPKKQRTPLEQKVAREWCTTITEARRMIATGVFPQ